METWVTVPNYPAYEVSDCGRIRRVTPSGKAKLSESDMESVRAMRERGMSHLAIARAFGVTKHAIASAMKYPAKFSFRGATRILKPQNNTNGYIAIGLCMGGVVRFERVHRLVCAAFMGPIPEGMVINHKNGDKRDNRVENLEIVSSSGNTRHSFRELGQKANRLPGSKNAGAKLSEQGVREMRRMRNDGVDTQTLASQFGVTRGTVQRIVARKVWKHV